MKILHINRIVYVSITALSLSLSGCGTMCCGTTQDIRVKAVDSKTYKKLSDVHCTATNNFDEKISIDDNPGIFTVSTGHGKLDVICTAPYYQQKEVVINRHFNKWVLGDVIYLPFFIVDAVEGSLKKYPSYVTVHMDHNMKKLAPKEYLSEDKKTTSKSTTRPTLG